jgi:hypothetical protein
MECIVEDIDTVHTVRPVTFEETDQPIQAQNETYTPVDFFRQSGTVIAICLGLAMVAQLLVPMIGN